MKELPVAVFNDLVTEAKVHVDIKVPDAGEHPNIPTEEAQRLVENAFIAGAEYYYNKVRKVVDG